MESHYDNINEIKQLANSGNVAKQLELADYYFYKEQNYECAFNWYQICANNDEPDGINGLGRCYSLGKGVEKDHIKAFELFKKAADKGSTKALCNLGICYSKGLGVKQNFDKSDYYYELAAELGNPMAQFTVGRKCLENRLGAITWQLTHKRDTIKAFDWFLKSANQGYAPSQYMIGRYYESGTDPIIENISKAIEWYEKAIKQNNAKAMFALGKIYQYGTEEIKPDFRKAFKLCLKAAQLGDKNAPLSVSYMYYYGQGVDKDKEKAIEWCRESIKHSSSDFKANIFFDKITDEESEIPYTISESNSKSEPSKHDRENSIIDEKGVIYSLDKKKVIEFGGDSCTDVEDFGYIDNNRLRKYEIPDGVEIICDGAFSGCKNLEELKLPKSLVIIGEFAFEGCTSLKNLIIPSNVEIIKSNAFVGVKSILSLSPKYPMYDNLLMSNDLKKFKYVVGNCKSVEIPEGIEVIETRAFSNSEIETVYIPSTVKSIENSAFECCEKLNEIFFHYNSKLETIDYTAFYGCKSLRTIELPNGLKIIHSQAFSNCENLYYVGIPDSLEVIETGAFEKTNIRNFTLPKNLINIGNGVFAQTPISSIKSRTNKYKVIDNVIYSEDLKTLIQNCDNKQKFVVPEHVETIGDFAFAYSEMQVLYITPHVKNVGKLILYQGYANKIIIPSSLRDKIKDSIDKYYFENCLEIRG